MELKQVSTYFDKAIIDVYDDILDGWRDGYICGQLKLADDFISIFNRPTRRRMLTTSPDEYEKIKNFSLIKEQSTGFLYLFGEPQHDINAAPYRTTLPLHKVTNQAAVTRRVTTGPANDPGVLTDTTMPSVYADIELRTLSNEGDTDNSIHTKQFMWLQRTADVIKGDILNFDGVIYKVLSTYIDTGFLGARITDEPDSREPYTYRKRTGDPTYNIPTGVYTPNYADYQISAELDSLEEESDNGDITADTLYTLLIEYPAIGFTPTIGDAMTLDGKDRIAVKIDRARHLESWKVVFR